jgi:hypothetical protein
MKYRDKYKKSFLYKQYFGKNNNNRDMVTGQTHLNLLGFSKDNRYSIRHPAFYL